MAVTRLSCLVLLALVAGLLLSCSEKDPPRPLPAPNAPNFLQVIGVTDFSIELRWTDLSQNEEGFIVYYRAVSDSTWLVGDSVAADDINARIEGLTPGTTYAFRVTSFNRNGESEPSDEITATTTAPALPNAPNNVQAHLLTETIVRVTWTDRGTQDSFIIQRREEVGGWVQLGSTPDNIEAFTDSSIQAQTTYFYRVGAQNATGIAWSADSAQITTPAPGAPLNPDDLVVLAYPGIGVQLTWIDRSTNELGFEIRRGRAGFQPQIIDTVAANTTSYFDSLGDAPDFYYYAVRAFNAIGASGWTPFVDADYRYCNNGLIPVCLDNYWDYSLDSNNTTYALHRRIVDVDFVDGLDFYLMGQRYFIDGPVDSMFYLRNVAGGGTLALPHPRGSVISPDTLFMLPPPLLPINHYFVHGDCVVVLTRPPGTALLVGDTTYTGVIAYQRFFDDLHSIQYFVKPYEVGIVREDEYLSSGNRVARRDLVRYQVQNQGQ